MLGRVTGNARGGGARDTHLDSRLPGAALGSLGCVFRHWCRKNLPRNGQRPSARDKATRAEQSSSRAGNGGAKESLLRAAASKAPRGREDGGYQKIVVSYLVLMPLLASCPGSTIHGRLARVFCSDGSICFKTERLMPVIRRCAGRVRGRRCPHLGPRPALPPGPPGARP